MKSYWDITPGKYMSTCSGVRRIEAGAKILELMALIITIFLFREINALVMMFFFSIWVVRQYKLPLRYVLRVMQGGLSASTKDCGGRAVSPWPYQ